MEVIAAVDGSSAAATVVDVATAFARRIGADVIALHARADARSSVPAVVTDLAEGRGLALRVLEGPAATAIVDAAVDGDVAAVVLGLRGAEHGKLPGGSTAMAVVTTVRRPVIVTPPTAHVVGIDRVLVPLEGTEDSTALPRIVGPLARGGARIVPLHVFIPSTVPSFWDQPHHAAPAWSSGFLARFGPPEAEDLWLRCGDVTDAVLDVVGRAAIDLVALTWTQDITGAHAPVVRALLARSPVPVLLEPRAGAPDRPAVIRRGQAVNERRTAYV